MENKNPQDLIKQFSEKTLGFLDQHNIYPTPVAYAVWYEYFSNNNIEITRYIDKYLEDGGIPNQIFTDKVYANFLSYEMAAKTVDSVSQMLLDQFSAALTILSPTDTALSDYQDILNNAQKALEDNNFTQDIASDLQQATQDMCNTIKKIEDTLQDSQEEIQRLKNYFNNVQQESSVDPLTRLPNRKKYDQFISQSIRKSIADDQPMCVLMLDIDHYEDFRLKWGQLTSEQILRFVAATIKNNIKELDFVARYSNSVFSLILSKTKLSEAKKIADLIRKTVEKKKIVKKASDEFIGRITLCASVASYHRGENVGTLCNRVDNALFAARANGYNCTVTEEKAADILRDNNSSMQDVS